MNEYGNVMHACVYVVLRISVPLGGWCDRSNHENACPPCMCLHSCISLASCLGDKAANIYQ